MQNPCASSESRRGLGEGRIGLPSARPSMRREERARWCHVNAEPVQTTLWLCLVFLPSFLPPSPAVKGRASLPRQRLSVTLGLLPSTPGGTQASLCRAGWEATAHASRGASTQMLKSPMEPRPLQQPPEPTGNALRARVTDPTLPR